MRKISEFVYLTTYLALLCGLIVGLDMAISLIPVTSWAQTIMLVTVNVTIALMFQHYARRLRGSPLSRITPERIWVDTREPADFMDPHGDGTLRPGDALFDNVFVPMIRGEFRDGVIMVRHEGGLFEVIEPDPRAEGAS